MGHLILDMFTQHKCSWERHKPAPQVKDFSLLLVPFSSDHFALGKEMGATICRGECHKGIIAVPRLSWPDFINNDIFISRTLM